MKTQQTAVFETNGVGQVPVKFLGRPLVLGCVEGQEREASERLARFEIDTGEVLRAISGIDHQRATLMAGMLAYERIEELEEQLAVLGASPKEILTLDHGDPAYTAALEAIDRLVVTIRDSNAYRASDPVDRVRCLNELGAGRKLLTRKNISRAAAAGLLAAIGHLALQFVDAPIGEAAQAAWAALKELVGL